MGFHELFARLASNMILMISASHVARIVGVALSFFAGLEGNCSVSIPDVSGELSGQDFWPQRRVCSSAPSNSNGSKTGAHGPNRQGHGYMDVRERKLIFLLMLLCWKDRHLRL
jgi:hypothetical protein